MSLLVKLTKIDSTLNGVKHVTGVNIELTTLGKKPTKATATAQTAQLEFYELPVGKDVETTNRRFATLSFKLKVDAKGKNPELDGENLPVCMKYETFVRKERVEFVSSGGGGSSIKREAPDFSTDFWLDLEIAQGDAFSKDAKFLFLPWETETEHNVLEVGARLLIAGAEESAVAENGILTVPLLHKGVPANGIAKNPPFDCYGVGMVYPTDNSLFSKVGEDAMPGASKATKMIPPSINIILNEAILVAHSKSVKLTAADLEPSVVAIFADVTGLPKPAIQVKSDADFTAIGLERRLTKRGKRWAAKAKLLPDADEWTFKEGLPMDFFDFWFSFETELTPIVPTEGAEAETIADFDPKAIKKQLVHTAAVFPRSVTMVNSCVPHPKLAAKEYRINELVRTIVHEIGHSLGLRHALRATGTGYDLGPKDHYDITRGLMGYRDVIDGVSPSGGFGPVHRDVLRNRFT